MKEKLSDYEQRWLSHTEPIVYRGYNIFEYESGFTFWYGEEDSEYVSSIASLAEAKLWIDKEFQCHQKKL